MSAIEWGDPPVDARGNAVADWAAIAAELRSRPGEWAKILDTAKQPYAATAIKTGRIKHFRPAGSFEAVSRKADADTTSIWARFVGTKP